jgi:hypothetical protein
VITLKALDDFPDVLEMGQEMFNGWRETDALINGVNKRGCLLGDGDAMKRSKVFSGVMIHKLKMNGIDLRI